MQGNDYWRAVLELERVSKPEIGRAEFQIP